MKQHVTLLAIFLLPFLAYPSCAQTPEFIVKGICKYRNPDEPLVAENIVSLDYRNLSHHAFMSKDFDRFPNLQAIVLSQHEDEPTELLLERISFGANCKSLRFLVLDSVMIDEELLNVDGSIKVIFSQASLVERCSELEQNRKAEVEYGVWKNTTVGLVDGEHFKRILRVSRHWDNCFISEAFDATTIEALGAAKTLVSLDLTETELAETEINAISRCRGLEEINLTAAQFPVLLLSKIPCQNLVSLRLGGCRVGPGFSTNLSFPRLEHLDLGGADLSEEDCTWILECDNLKSLKLTGAAFPTKFFKSLVEMENLTALTLYDDFAEVEEYQELVNERPDLKIKFSPRPLEAG